MLIIIRMTSGERITADAAKVYYDRGISGYIGRTAVENAIADGGILDIRRGDSKAAKHIVARNIEIFWEERWHSMRV